MKNLGQWSPEESARVRRVRTQVASSPSDWNIGGQDIDDLRLVFAGGASVGIRSPQAGIEAAAMFEKIERPTELRCGPVYVRNPGHVGTGYELTDQHRRTVKRIAAAEKIVRALHKASPGALQVLKLVYLYDGVEGFKVFDVELGDHGAKLSRLVVPIVEPRLSSVRDGVRDPMLSSIRGCYEASGSNKPIYVWLGELSSRVAKAKAAAGAADLSMVKRISEDSLTVLAAASMAWQAARGGRHG